MEGASSGLGGHLDDILPKDAQFVLAWNPEQFCAEGDSKADVTRAPPDTAPSALRTTTLWTSPQAAFYNKHLAPHLILERVVYFDTLVSTIANTVDQAIQAAVAKRPLPKDTGALLPEKVIKEQVYFTEQTKYYEAGVVETYSKFASTYCLPIASTLALHPSSERWSTILNWSADGKIGRWAIADGVLRISRRVFENDQLERRFMQNEDEGKKGIIRQLALGNTTLAVWEMRSLTVGTARVMQEIAEMGLTHAKFPWKKCTLTPCNHRFWKGMEEPSESYDAGVDACSPPWTLPSVPSKYSVDSRPTSPRKLRSASARGSTTSWLSYEKPSSSSVEDGERVGDKSRHDDSEYKQPPPKKLKTGLMDESYKQPSESGTRQEANAQSFLQQVA